MLSHFVSDVRVRSGRSIAAWHKLVEQMSFRVVGSLAEDIDGINGFSK